ncbi:hypothetical protein SAMD00019534_087910 [Acytostelium subglobosum LB1]|uniref:hypothetical protein n=1 Tax=Acytostelium subglobosum LB1 TaxID=1410327 RepID=UPI000644EFAF|nr:hypothetical protein SAMD00019534_087910 [Acytostelium subglobosum LB1]GAM25616.1 hypothetical protein SAMD00019534_087910 [Acytostelium subglobosum LB1]|eukprot:XP_012751602.1 hypothetical protein SAMD00019534_087910 [Acytostelium subglobosum LB1]
MQRLLSTIGEALAPSNTQLDELKNHWRAIKTFYNDNNEESKAQPPTTGRPGPCFDFFLKNRILETLCLLGERDTPSGVRKLVLQTTTILLSDVSMPLLPHMSIHRPICRLISSIVNQAQDQDLSDDEDDDKDTHHDDHSHDHDHDHEQCEYDDEQQQQQQHSLHSSAHEIQHLVPSLNPHVCDQANDESEFVNLLETLTKKLKLNPSLVGFFQDERGMHGERFIVYRGLSRHLWTVGSVGERARKALLQCLELLPSTNNSLSQAGEQRSRRDSSASRSPPQSPLKRSALELSMEDQPEIVEFDPNALLNRVQFVVTQIKQLAKVYSYLPSKLVSSADQCGADLPPIDQDTLCILECYKARVSFCCSLSSIKHHDIGENISRLWDEQFIAITLKQALLDNDELHAATAMLYLREILPLLHGPVYHRTISFIVGSSIRPEAQHHQVKKDDDTDELQIRTALINRISHPNPIVSLSCLRLFSTLLSLNNFVVLYNMIIVNLPIDPTPFSYHNLATLQAAHQSIKHYLSLFVGFGNNSSSSTLADTQSSSQTASTASTSTSSPGENDQMNQSQGYASYLVDARYQVSFYSTACAPWPDNYLFITKEAYQLLHNNGGSGRLNSSGKRSSGRGIPPTSSFESLHISHNRQGLSNYNMGPFLEEIFKLLRNVLSLPVEITSVLTGIISKLCYYPCPQLYPHLVHVSTSGQQQMLSTTPTSNHSSNSPIPSLHSVLQDLSNQINERSKDIQLFDQSIETYRSHLANLYTHEQDDNQVKEPPALPSTMEGLSKQQLDFLHSTIILQEFSKELASIIHARVIFSHNY